jgi:hypothetical protein
LAAHFNDLPSKKQKAGETIIRAGILCYTVAIASRDYFGGTEKWMKQKSE